MGGNKKKQCGFGQIFVMHTISKRQRAADEVDLAFNADQLITRGRGPLEIMLVRLVRAFSLAVTLPALAKPARAANTALYAGFQALHGR